MDKWEYLSHILFLGHNWKLTGIRKGPCHYQAICKVCGKEKWLFRPSLEFASAELPDNKCQI